MNEDTAFERLTVRSSPPSARRRQRRSYWPGVLAEGRGCPGEWIRTVKAFNQSTAQQLASDLRNAHKRSAKKMRISGILPGDRWDARWGRDVSDPNPANVYLWIRFIGTPELLAQARDDEAW